MSQSNALVAFASRPLSSETQPPTTFHNWSELPVELKVEILSHHLTSPGPITAVHHQYLMDTILDPLILTGLRDLVELALETYCNNNTFELHLNHPIERKTGMAYPKPKYAKMIRHLTIVGHHATISENLEELVLNRDAAWRWLLRPTTPLGRLEPSDLFIIYMSAENQRTNTAWQETFTNLKSLGITLEVAHADLTKRTYGCIGKGCAASIVENLKDTVLDLKAKKVEVRVRHEVDDADTYAWMCVPQWQECDGCWEVAAPLKDMAVKK